MSGTRQVPSQYVVAWWVRMLKIHARGCLEAVPDRADPLAVAAYNEARRQLAAEARAQARAEPEPTP
jgi:hypothetical protein